MNQVPAMHDQEYLRVMREIYEKGVVKSDRTGTGTKAVFSRQMRFDLSDGSFPLLTTKKIFTRTMLEELFWMLRGETNIRPLVLRNVHIWNEWPFALYLKKHGIGIRDLSKEEWNIRMEEFIERIKVDEQFALEHGELGPVYGSQWRKWRTFTEWGDSQHFIEGEPIDQVAELIDQIKKNPDSRSMIVTAWNPAEYKWLRANSLPPCHMMFQCFVTNGKLSLDLTQRSCDFFLGVPFNVPSYSAFLLMLAHMTGLQPGEFIWNGKDVHLYLNHTEQVEEQLSRTPKPSPKIAIIGSVDHIEDFSIENFDITGYSPDPHIPAPVSV